jgi:hypothetical protein
MVRLAHGHTSAIDRCRALLTRELTRNRRCRLRRFAAPLTLARQLLQWRIPRAAATEGYDVSGRRVAAADAPAASMTHRGEG